MRILFATAQPFPPQMYGGLQICVSTLISALNKRGKTGTLLCALMGKGWIGLRGRMLMKLTGAKAAPDHVLNHATWRAWFPWESILDVVAKTKPDVIVIPARLPVRMAIAAQKTGVPVVMWLQDVEYGDHGGNFAELGNIPCVANSAFTAEKFRNSFNVSPVVIHPLMNKENYKTETTRENITFINPHTFKGLDIALAVAGKCPDIPFIFLETWPLSAAERQSLNDRLALLKNVTFRPSVSDMREIYGKAKILLAPSQWEEAFGRVASEAQFSGIPVIASNRGGLPEAVGSGGTLLDPQAPVDKWVSAIRALWDNPEYYKEMSTRAYANAARAELDPEHQITLWENILESAVKNKNAKV